MRVATVKQVAEYLQCHISTIYRLLKRNQIPAFKVGSDWRFSLDAIDRWILKKEAYSTRPFAANESDPPLRAG